MATTDHPQVILFPPLLFVLHIAAAYGLDEIWPLPYLMPVPMRISLGVAAFLLGLALIRWGRATMQAVGTGIRPALGTSAIVSDGSFRYTRNPLYMGMLLMYLGLITGFSLNWGYALLLPLLLVLHFGIILREERYLLRKFGAPYQAYCQQVRRYL